MTDCCRKVGYVVKVFFLKQENEIIYKMERFLPVV